MAFNEQMFYNIIGERIRTARQHYRPRMSQAQLAEKLNLSRASVVNIEAGRQRPPLHVLWHIAESLDTELRLLLPSRDEYMAYHAHSGLDEQTVSHIEAVAGGNATTRELLTEFITRVKGQQ
jgi:transcriptional regulator with XRE-family HTH domain